MSDLVCFYCSIGQGFSVVCLVFHFNFYGHRLAMGEFLHRSRQSSDKNQNLHQSQQTQLKPSDKKDEKKQEESISSESPFETVVQHKWDSDGEEDAINNQRRGPVPLMEEIEEEPIQRSGPIPTDYYAPDAEEPVQRKGPVPLMNTEEEEPVQRKGPVPPLNTDSEELPESASSASERMPSLVQRKMESSFGEDFSDVTIHKDSPQSKELNAHAFTKGNAIHFAPGMYNPESQDGQELLGHELTHVVQQREGRVRPTVQKKGVGINNDEGLEKEADEMGEMAAKGEPVGGPTHSLVKANDHTDKEISSAVKEDLQKVVDTVKSLSGVDIGTKFGDTTRRLNMTTTKVGADNISWHKTGRAVDFNQGLKWVIAENPDGEDMYFRIYLLKTNDTTSSYDTTFVKDQDKFHVNPYGNSVYNKNFIDVTAILEENGFARIKAHKGWENTYNKREWWHYEKRDNLSMYEALKQVYTEEEIVNGYKGMIALNKESTCARLKREGFEDAIIIKMIGAPIKMGEMSLYCSVGEGGNVPNLEQDVVEVKRVLNKLGIESADCEMTELNNLINYIYEKFNGKKMSIPVLSAGGLLHKRLGTFWENGILKGDMILYESVGYKKANFGIDVIATKVKLNKAYEKGLVSMNGNRLTLDGSVSEAFILAIKEFQSKVVKASVPTGEIYKGSLSHSKLGEL